MPRIGIGAYCVGISQFWAGKWLAAYFDCLSVCRSRSDDRLSGSADKGHLFHHDPYVAQMLYFFFVSLELFNDDGMGVTEQTLSLLICGNYGFII